ncbi:MAG TPA: peptide chain release factor N(5)-glutamine methyltransferase [Gaiellaceae bacterium]|jgi:release factor glutamine methyltransferase|nr:peptide chain release factor N(5)-glutamine methyltransferase [Gaiellaceae bacterium]
MTAQDAVRTAAAELQRAGCPSPRVDAEWLVGHALGMTRTELYADGSRELASPDEERLGQLVARRAGREPLAYVLGEWGFRSLTLKVDRRVLIPRPETEVLVERCLELLAGAREPRVLDVGVGSGAIALAIADEHPTASVVATDNSPGALELAAENRARAGLEGRVELVEGDLFAGLAGPFDLVVSNPPYVEPHELPSLEPEVRDFEPRAALVAPGVTEALARGAPDVLRPGGVLCLETADKAAAGVAHLLSTLGYRDVTTTADVAGRDRVVDGRTHR